VDDARFADRVVGGPIFGAGAEPGRIVVVTYGENCCVKSKALLCGTAVERGADACRAFSEGDLEAGFVERVSRVLAVPQGAGLWVWKPYVVLEILKRVREGDYVVYSDAGAVFKGGVRGLLEAFEIDEVAKAVDVVVWSVGLKNGRYCKRDAFVLMEVDEKSCHEAMQVNAFFLVVRKSEKSVALVEEWLRYSEDIRIIGNRKPPSEMEIGKSLEARGVPFERSNLSSVITEWYPRPENKELKEFQKHRHDQAVLTNVLCRRGLYPRNYIDNPEANEKGNILDAIVVHHRVKN